MLCRTIRCWIISGKVESRQHWFYQIVVLNIETILDPFTFSYSMPVRARYCPPSISKINDYHNFTDLFSGCSNQRQSSKRAVIRFWRGNAITYKYIFVFGEWKMHELHDTTTVWKNKSNLFDVIRPFLFRRRAFAEHELQLFVVCNSISQL